MYPYTSTPASLSRTSKTHTGMTHVWLIICVIVILYFHSLRSPSEWRSGILFTKPRTNVLNPNHILLQDFPINIDAIRHLRDRTVWWWRHDIELVSAFTGPFWPVDSHKGPAIQSFGVFFVLGLIKVSNKQSIWWFDTPCDVTVMILVGALASGGEFMVDFNPSENCAVCSFTCRANWNSNRSSGASAAHVLREMKYTPYLTSTNWRFPNKVTTPNVLCFLAA